MSPSARQPVLFIGHGSPMNAIVDNAWSRAFRALGATLAAQPAPRAIVCVSAHWYVDGTWVTDNDPPPTIHDFGGFPAELFAVTYPAPGSPAVTARTVELLAAAGAKAASTWGLDHGTWTVLHHLRPRADVPVVQVAIDRGAPPAAHVALGRALAPLRDEGVLVLASGNITHDLAHAMRHMHAPAPPPDWAERFDGAVAAAAAAHDTARLAALALEPDGQRAHPSLDHYLPLLYAAGAADPTDPVSFPVTGWDLSSLSMRAVRYG